MNPYQVDTSEANIYKPLISLDVLYKGMPKTTGCNRCKEVNGENVAWCCKEINPSMYYIEFLRVWKTIQNSWSKEKKSQLLIRAIRNYLDMGQRKGCIFWDKECLVYKDRPIQCRLYGVIPQEVWDKRIKAIKKREKDFDCRPQCNLVNSEKPITVALENKWFNHTKQCEERIGVSDAILKLHDLPGGSYRTFHDHLLLEILEVKAMNMLTQVKVTKPSKEDIDLFAETLASKLRKKL